MNSHKMLFFLLFLLCSCANNNNSSFPVRQDLNHELISTDVQFHEPDQIVFLQDAVFVLDRKSEYFFHVFSALDLSYYGSYIRKGHGPEEETSIFQIRPIEKNQFIYVTDNYVKIMDFDVANKSLKQVESFKTNKLFEVFKLDQNLFGIPRSFYEKNNKEFLEYKSSLDSCIAFGPNFLSRLKRYNNSEQIYLSSKKITVRPDHQLFAAVYGWFPVLRIYHSKNGDLKREIHFKTNQPFPDALLDEKLTIEQTRERTWKNYLDIQSTENFIYGMFAGKSLAELYPAEVLDDFPVEIHVWDWEGNLVKCIQLDHNIFSFTVSPDDKYLLAISWNQEEHLLRFEL